MRPALLALPLLAAAGCFESEPARPPPATDTGAPVDEDVEDTGGEHSSDGDTAGDGDTGGDTGEGGDTADPITWYEDTLQGATAIATFCDHYNGVSGHVIVDVAGLADLSALHCLVEVRGELRLTSALSISSLEGLDSLVRVGGLTIEDQPALRDLTGAPLLQTINRHLLIQGSNDPSTSGLQDTSGLSSLETIGGSLRIEGAQRLETISGFDALRSIGMTLFVSGTDALTRVESFSMLESVRQIFFWDTRALAEVSGFDALTELYSAPGYALYLDLGPGAAVTGFSALERADKILISARGGTTVNSLAGLGALREVDWMELELDNSDGPLTDLSELASLERVDELHLLMGRLDAMGTTALRHVDLLEIRAGGDVSLDGLEGVEQLSSGLELWGATSLNLDGLRNLEEVGGQVVLYSVSFTGSLDSLRTVTGDVEVRTWDSSASLSLPALETISGDLQLQNSPTLAGLSLPLLATIGGDLLLSDNTSLTGLSLPTLSSVGGNLQVTDAPALTSLSMPALATIGGDLWLQDDTALVSASLPALAHVTGNTTIHWNTELESLDLSSLATTGGDLVLSRNRDMGSMLLGDLSAVGGDLRLISNHRGPTDLDGLSSLRTVAGDLEIDDNRALVDVAGLHGLLSVTGDLRITDNPDLPTAAAEALRDAIPTIGGTVTISGNAP